MKAKDFEFDGKLLSSFGFAIVSFGGNKGLETIDGSEITFNTISSLGGSKYNLVSTHYESCLELTIQVCKYSCKSDVKEIAPVEFRELTRWLNRKGFYKLKFLDNNSIDLYYMASIKSINKIELDGRLMGLELNIVTNSPHAFKEPRTIIIKNTDKETVHCIHDTSHEEGYIYPYTKITIGDIGSEKMNLDIYNAMEDRHTIIKNCVSGEVITMDYPVIRSTDSSHKIQNDFNWNFFRIVNTYDCSRNHITISIPCTIEMKYSPIIKVGL